jgi:hypothetical protein
MKMQLIRTLESVKWNIQELWFNENGEEMSRKMFNISLETEPNKREVFEKLQEIKHELERLIVKL